jgi:hypothetical protein
VQDHASHHDRNCIVSNLCPSLAGVPHVDDDDDSQRLALLRLKCHVLSKTSDAHEYLCLFDTTVVGKHV